MHEARSICGLQYTVGSKYAPEAQTHFDTYLAPFISTTATAELYGRLEQLIAKHMAAKDMQGEISIASPSMLHIAFDCLACSQTPCH